MPCCDLILILVTTMCLPLLPIMVTPCQRRACQASTELGDRSSPILNLLPEKFPPLKFSDNLAPISEMDDQILTAQQMNMRLKTVSLILSHLVKADATQIASKIWKIVESQFLTLVNIAELQRKKFEYQIRNEVTQSHVHLMMADVDALKISMERMLNPELSNDTKIREVVPARFACKKIVGLFSNKNFIFWKENMVTAPYLLTFSLVHATLATLSKALDPSHVDHYDGREKEFLITLLGQYRDDLIRKRVSVLREQNVQIVDQNYHWLYGQNGSVQWAHSAACDHLYFTKCTDYIERSFSHEHVMPIYHRRRSSIQAQGSNETSCSQGILDEKVRLFYAEVTSHSSCSEPMNCAGDLEPIHPIFGRPGAPALNENFVYDPTTKNYVCGPPGQCLQDYRKVLDGQVRTLFEEHVKVVAAS